MVCNPGKNEFNVRFGAFGRLARPSPTKTTGAKIPVSCIDGL